jgi:metal-sulfur cluster biosynthetic enzyme
MNEPRDINPHTGKPYPAETDSRASESASGAPTPANAAEPAGAAAPGAPASKPDAASAGGAPTQQELAIRSALETVMDPEIGLSVVDLGLIREIAITPGRTLIRMMLTTPFCPYAPQLVAEVKAAAQSVVPQECDVDLMPDPWSPELMPDPSLLGYSF